MGIFILALLMFSVIVTLTDLFMRDIVKVAVDMALSTISFTGLLVVLFIGNNLMAGDIEKRTIYMVISRPLSRSEYLIGKAAGLMLLVICTVSFLGLFSVLPVYFADISYKNAQSIFEWNIYFKANALDAMKLILITSVIIFFASFSSSSFISFILSIAVYLIGSSTETVKGLARSASQGMEVSPQLASVINAAYYLFPNLAAFDVKIQAAHGLSLPDVYLLWTFLYGLFYTAILLSAGALIIRRREFP